MLAGLDALDGFLGVIARTAEGCVKIALPLGLGWLGAFLLAPMNPAVCT
jgi:hypothetical protein